MVWSIMEDMKKLPITNRNACRRAMLKGIAAVKDTIKEFKEYIDEANEFYANGGVEGEDNTVNDQWDEDDLQSTPYTHAEVETVLKIIEQFECTERVMRYAVSCLTMVNDFIEPSDNETPSAPPAPATSAPNDMIMPPLPPVPSSDLINISLSANDENLKIVEDSANLNDLIKLGRGNTYKICNLVEKFLPNAASELGNELFTPFDDDAVVEKRNALNSLINTLYNDVGVSILILNRYCVLQKESNGVSTIPTAESAINLQRTYDQMNEIHASFNKMTI